MRVFLIVGCLGSLLLLTACRDESSQNPPAKPEPAAIPETFDAKRLSQIGPETCRSCHADIVEGWADSHHALANRPVDAALDDVAFTPARTVNEPQATFTLGKKNGEFIITEVSDGTSRSYPLAGVIAYSPLRQYLAPFPGGRFQTTSVAYDPAEDEWFEVFEGEGRVMGEWGHWTGQGMNWNANCAYCHMTDFKKNFALETESYHSTWLQQGIACAQCHEGLEEHLIAVKQSGYKPGRLTMSDAATMASCASCHSRREQLTPDTFEPGDLYADHFALSLPDQPGLYYPDGQIRDEVFVYGSFMMSRMGHAGVTCLDCHDAHTNAMILPAQNNSLCMRCHSTGLDEAPIIEPTRHSHHAAGSTGNQCINCHMPHTTYMQRDPRRDHGFLSPDPLMTQELGIPNACNGCHTEESVDWAVGHAEKWYGEKLAQMPQRARARALHAAYEGEPDAFEALLILAQTEDVAAWQATYTGLLGNYATVPGVTEYLREQLSNKSPWVRARAVTGLAPVPWAGDLLHEALDDPIRQVRLRAAQAFLARGLELPEGQAAEEWQSYLNFNADRPQDAFWLAQEAVQGEDAAVARKRIAFAVSLDRASPEVLRRAAILYSMLGDNVQAEASLNEALEIDPQSPDVLYSLALLKAEEGDFESTAALLEDVVMIAPDFYRAWYNLALAYTKLERWRDAATALEKAAPAMSQDPGWLQTRAIVEAQLMRTGL